MAVALLETIQTFHSIKEITGNKDNDRWYYFNVASHNVEMVTGWMVTGQTGSGTEDLTRFFSADPITSTAKLDRLWLQACN
ncbi:hypothetical protein M8C21_010235 [Ambrosia artemisiifolia]|uniref:Uncharacterized protein n=1 Tax=Ambrosia artemisiifolia TaxID=4212 RepID=A0AAD5GVS2_AMBAR|nr:hypothetical protein M8C21_010235 [Ambrosia artemisiifolia]